MGLVTSGDVNGGRLQLLGRPSHESYKISIFYAEQTIQTKFNAKEKFAYHNKFSV